MYPVGRAKLSGQPMAPQSRQRRAEVRGARPWHGAGAPKFTPYQRLSGIDLVPSEDPDFEDLGHAFPAWNPPSVMRSCSPSPKIRPAAEII